MKRYQILSFLLLLMTTGVAYSQSLRERYKDFKKQTESKYTSFREDCNKQYAQFLLTVWDWYEGKTPLSLPMDNNPLPPKPYNGRNNDAPIVISPIGVNPIKNIPQPKPIEPIKEIPTLDEDYFTLKFYNQECKIRLPKFAKLSLNDCQPKSIASGWESLCNEGMNNAIRDCLETRIRYYCCPIKLFEVSKN